MVAVYPAFVGFYDKDPFAVAALDGIPYDIRVLRVLPSKSDVRLQILRYLVLLDMGRTALHTQYPLAHILHYCIFIYGGRGIVLQFNPCELVIANKIVGLDSDPVVLAGAIYPVLPISGDVVPLDLSIAVNIFIRLDMDSVLLILNYLIIENKRVGGFEEDA